MKKILSIYILALSTCLLSGSWAQTSAAVVTASQDTNLVLNSSFEDPAPALTAEDSLPKWTLQFRHAATEPAMTPAEMAVINDPAEAHSGSHFLRVTPKDRDLGFNSIPNEHLDPGLYEISMWAKGRTGTWGGFHVDKLTGWLNLIQLSDRWQRLGQITYTGGFPKIDMTSGVEINSANMGLSFGHANEKMAGLADNLPNPQIDIDDVTVECLTSGLADAFGDHMVLQRDRPLPIWGWAKDPGQKVTVKLNDQTATVVSDKDGRWQVKFPPMRAGGPYTLELNGRIAAYDVMLGDVWVCSGQSNMEFGLDLVNGQYNHAPEVVAKADCPMLRLWQCSKQWSANPMHNYLVRQDDQNGPCQAVWNVCTPTTVKRGIWGGFSAIGYFFGREIQEDQKVAVGLMMITNGGTQIESFISAEGLKSVPQDQWLVQPLAPDVVAKLDTLPKLPATITAPSAGYGEAILRYTSAKGFQANLDFNDNFKHPSAVFNGFVAPVFPMSVRGVLWFQGEHNGGIPGDTHYEAKLKALIADWRARFDQKDMPFIIGQLCNLGTFNPPAQNFHLVRDAEFRVSKTVPDTALAVSIDCADPQGFGNGPMEIHFKNKQDVGHRMALAAKALTYGEKLISSGPIYRDMKIEGNKIRLSFDSVGAGLDARGGKLNNFTMAGDDHHFVDADAAIDGDTVVVSAPSVPNPVAVRYAFISYVNPQCNLYNKDGLPASPFRTDDLPLEAAR